MTTKPNNEIRVVIVGRPNVGKSTLFNRLIGKKKALVHDLPGVTRDRVEEKVEWKLNRTSYSVRIIDTGGMGGDRFAKEIDEQVQLALEKADVVLFVGDSQTGVTPADQQISTKLSEKGIPKKMPVLAVVNKVDNPQHEERIYDFYALGFENVMAVSAEHDRGVELLKEWIVNNINVEAAEELDEEALEELQDPMSEEFLDDDILDEEIEETDQEKRDNHIPRVAIVGRPNAGKSTLTNALLGEKRMITSPIAGTTVDAVDSEVELGGRPHILIDTAGIRKKSKTEQGVEVLSVVLAKKALDRCDIAILMLDGESGITDQDEKIAGLIDEAGPGVILAVNKWDTQKKNKDFSKEDAAERIREKMAFMKYAPIIFISAKERRGLDVIPDLIEEILEQRKTHIATKEFSEWVRKTVAQHNPFNAKFFMSHQSGRYPPTFVCHVSNPDKIHFSLKRHLVNGIRERWGFMGSPVRLLFKTGKVSKRKKPSSPRK